MARNNAGRGRGRGGNGGRGHGRGGGLRSGGNATTNNNNSQKKAKLLFTPPGVDGVKNPPSYHKVKEAICNHIMDEFEYGEDLVDSLRKMEMVDLDKEKPKKQVSSDPDPDVAQEENETFELEFKAELEEHIPRKKFLRSNKTKIAGQILAHFCHKVMLTQLQDLDDYESKFCRDPIALLEEISIQMRQSEDKEHFHFTAKKAFVDFFGIEQKEGETLQEYRERFKTARQDVRRYIGDKYLEPMALNEKALKDDYAKLTDQKDKDAYLKELVSWHEAMTFFKGSDQKKYGAYLKHVKRQYSSSHDQYPRTLEEAMVTLRMQGNDTAGNGNRRNQGQGQGRNNNAGNNSSNRSQPQSTTATGSSNNQAPRWCWVCGDLTHVMPECPERHTRPRREWEQTIRRQAANASGSSNNQTVSGGNASTNNSDAGSVTSEVTTTSRRSRNLDQFFQAPSVIQASSSQDCAANNHDNYFRGDLRNALMLDSGTTSTMVCNRDMVKNIHDAAQSIYMNSNFGGHEIHTRGTLKEIPNHEVWVHDKGSANVVSLSELEEQCGCTVKYERGLFRVFTPTGKVIDFKRNFQGLFLYWPSSDRSDLATVRGNVEGFTKRQVDRAKAARELYHKVGAPTITNLKALIRQNLISDCPVTAEDVDLAEKIFGPDAATLKGRTTRSNPTPAKADYIEIPTEILADNTKIKLFLDVMYINKIPLLTAIDDTIKYRSVSIVKGKSDDDYYEAIDKILRLYNKGGFRITHIMCDGEFKSMMDAVCDGMDIVMNYANPGDHVPEIERNNRLLKERIRIAYHRLPYTNLPRVMVEYLAMVVAFQVNIFPAKNGVSKYYSPHMLLTKRNLNFNKHFKFEFGAYVQAGEVHDTTNRLDSRSVAGIYLRPTDNFQGGHEIYALNTGKVITRTKLTVLPISDHIIDEVNRLGAKQGFKSFKFSDRHKRPDLPDPDQIAGVVDVVDGDNDDDEDDEDYDPEDDEELDDDDYDDFDEAIVRGNNNDNINDEVNEDDDSDDGSDESDDEAGEDDDADEAIVHVSDDAEDDDENVEGASEDPADPAGVDDDSNDGEEESDLVQDDQGATEVQESEDEDDEPSLRRSTRTRTPVDRLSYKQRVLRNRLRGALLIEQELRKPKAIRFNDDVCNRGSKQYHLNVTETDMNLGYSMDEAAVLARAICSMRHGAIVHGASYMQQYLLNKGLKVFGEEGKKAATLEAEQMIKRNCFEPIHVHELTAEERMRAQVALMFLTEKRSGEKKGRMVYNGKPTRDWLSREEASSPTVTQEGVSLTASIDAHEERDVMTNDIPNAFIQTFMPPPENGQQRVIMKIEGPLLE